MIFQNVFCSNPGNISSSPVILPAQVLPEIAVILGGEGAAPFSSVAQMREAASKVVDQVEARIKAGKLLAFGWDENQPRKLKNMKDMNLGFVFEKHLILFWKGFPCKIVKSLAGNS